MFYGFLRRSSLLILLFSFQHTFSLAQDMGSLPPNQLVLPAADQRIAFIWQGDSMGTAWNPHSAMLIPVKLKNCPRQFYMQFDLGTPNSILYKNKIQDIAKKYPKAISWNDSLNKLVDLRFRVDKTEVTAKEISFIKLNGRVNWDKDAKEIIGTLGADLIENRIVMINYPETYLLLSNDTETTAGLPLVDFMFARRAVLLPATLKGKKLMLYFDTGSSAFELLTSKETATALAAPGAETTTYPVQSWNNTLIANTVPTNDSIRVGEQTIPLVASTYVENVSQTMIDQMLKMGIGGMTGNKLFLDYTLILDTRNKKFGLKRAVK